MFQTGLVSGKVMAENLAQEQHSKFIYTYYIMLVFVTHATMFQTVFSIGCISMTPVSVILDLTLQ